MLWMFAAKPLGDQHLNEPADEFFPRISEQRLGLGVDEHDVPIPVHDDNGIGRGLKESPRTCNDQDEQQVGESHGCRIHTNHAMRNERDHADGTPGH